MKKSCRVLVSQTHHREVSRSRQSVWANSEIRDALWESVRDEAISMREAVTVMILCDNKHPFIIKTHRKASYNATGTYKICHTAI